jgi:CDP-4-dehydro-6-deoxyglucose reductase
VLLCQAVALGDVAVEITAIRTPDAVEVKSLPCRVHSLERLTPDVMMVMLRLPAVEPFAFHAGQYLDVLLPDRRRRSFSIASSPDDPSLLELHVRRVEGGAFTPRVFDELTVGALLRIEGPLGRFIYTPASDGILLLVAGGTGFAPLKSMIAMLLKQGLTRPTRLYWGVRRPPDLYQREWLDARLKACPMLSFVPVLSDPGQDSSLWRTGFVHEAVLADHSDLTDAQIYAAGPPAMIEALENGAIARGLAPERFHADVFSYAVDPR